MATPGYGIAALVLLQSRWDPSLLSSLNRPLPVTSLAFLSRSSNSSKQPQDGHHGEYYRRS